MLHHASTDSSNRSNSSTNTVLWAAAVALTIPIIAYVGMKLLAAYRENISTPVTFMTAEDTSSFILNDEDRYVESMTHVDIYARHCRTHTEYLQRAAAAAHNVTPGAVHSALRRKARCRGLYWKPL